MLGSLYYSDGSHWIEVPVWAHFFANLGSITVRSVNPGTRLIVGLAIPARSYAAALAAFGIVITRSTMPVDQITDAEHFQRLCNLEIGSAVSLLDHDRKLKGVFTGCTKINEEDRIGIRVHNRSSGGLTYQISLRDSLRVEISSVESEKLPKKQTGKLVPPLAAFARHFLGKDQAKLFAKQSRLDCALLGRINAFKREIMQTRFAVETSKKELAEGRLQDVLRVRRLIKEGEHFRSEVFRIDGKKPPVADYAAPYITIFDGATSFLRWRDSQRDSNWVILLDRTDPYFRDAAAMLDQEYIRNRINDEGLKNVPTPPPGVELVSYYESCR